MYNLRDRAQKAQKELLDVVLEFYKQNPERCFTATKIRKALGLYRGIEEKSNDWIAQGFIFELETKGLLKKCPPREGHKYNPKGE